MMVIFSVRNGIIKGVYCHGQQKTGNCAKPWSPTSGSDSLHRDKQESSISILRSFLSNIVNRFLLSTNSFILDSEHSFPIYMANFIFLFLKICYISRGKIFCRYKQCGHRNQHCILTIVLRLKRSSDIYSLES